MFTLGEMKSQFILIVSARPLLREGLKYLFEEGELSTVITAPDEKSAESLTAEVAPDIVVIDRPDTRGDELVYFLPWRDKPAKVVVLGWSDNKLAVYCRRQVLPATLQNLLKAVRGSRSL